MNLTKNEIVALLEYIMKLEEIAESKGYFLKKYYNNKVRNAVLKLLSV